MKMRCVTIFVLWVFASLASPAQAQENDAAVGRRANELLKQMTPEEKMGQLNLLFSFTKSPALDTKIQAGEIGGLLFVTDPEMINAYQRQAVEHSRLHIPILFGFDVIHGFRTILPMPIALAASWDPDSVEKAQAVAADEARAAGVPWVFGPMVDIARDPRWGRIAEGAGEDPYLGAAIAAAQVRGFQGPYIGAPHHVMACVKHFAGYGAAEGGRDYDAANISDDQLWNVYLPPFRGAIEAGVGSVMSAYMDLNGVPATGNRWLLHDVLREQLQFKGFVVSDSNAVRDLKTHGFADSIGDAGYRAFAAGVNMEMSLGNTAFSRGLPLALQDGRITVQQLDDAVRPILEAKFRLGLFEHPYVDPETAQKSVADPTHLIVSQTVAERSAVLLKNEGNLLPLDSSRYKKIAVLGPMADSQIDTTGSWAFLEDWTKIVTVYNGLKSLAGANTDIQFAQGVQVFRKYASPVDGIIKAPRQKPWSEDQSKQEFERAVSLASASDLSILVLGEAQNMSGEMASTSTLELPGREQQLLEAVVAAGKPVVVVLMNGRPLDIRWAVGHVPAILEVWYPGTNGGAAVANLLYGKATPGGKLPFTWPQDVGQVPLFYAHNLTHTPSTQNRRYWNEDASPLFPFGFGLSYAQFKFSNLKIAEPNVAKGESLHVTVDVTNSGTVSADEVVQLYIHQQSGTSSRPVRELKGFARLNLEPNATRTAHFTLTRQDLTYWSSATRGWVQDAAQFDVWAGGDSNADLHATFQVVGSMPK